MTIQKNLLIFFVVVVCYRQIECRIASKLSILKSTTFASLDSQNFLGLSRSLKWSRKTVSSAAPSSGDSLVTVVRHGDKALK